MRSAAHEVREAAAWLVSAARQDPDDLGAGSYAFMQLLGVVAVGWMWLRMAKVALAAPEEPLAPAKLVTARHYAMRALPECATLRRRVEAGAETLMALAPADFVRA